MKRLLLLFCVLFGLPSLVGGCSLDLPGPDVSGNPSGDEIIGVVSSALPLVDGPITLTYWTENPYLQGSADKNSSSGSISYRELERRTGVHIEFSYPKTDSVYDEYKLMIASRDLPDLIRNPGSGFPGGIEAAIDSGIFIDLKDYLEVYAPNYFAAINASEERLRDATTDSGYYAAFWQINDPVQGPWIGPAVRKDWLDKLGMDTPETIDEWEQMLRGFRDVMGSTTPYKLNHTGIAEYGNILSAFDVARSFFMVGGEVKFGPMERGYFDYLALMAGWYSEGLINSAFYNQRSSDYIASFTEDVGACNAVYVYIGAGQAYNINSDDPGIHTVAVPYPVINSGDKIHIRRDNPEIANTNTSITSSCRDVINAIKWMDFAFTDEGAMVLNFGVEGETYALVDGVPRLTGLITDNPEGLSPVNAMRKYLSLHHPTRYYWWRELDFVSDEGIDAINNIWTIADADYVLPPISLTPSEGWEFERIMSQIEPFVADMTVKIIMGIEPLDIYEEFVMRLESYGIDEAIKIQQAALERYYAR